MGSCHRQTLLHWSSLCTGSDAVHFCTHCTSYNSYGSMQCVDVEALLEVSELRLAECAQLLAHVCWTASCRLVPYSCGCVPWPAAGRMRSNSPGWWYAAESWWCVYCSDRMCYWHSLQLGLPCVRLPCALYHSASRHWNSCGLSPCIRCVSSHCHVTCSLIVVTWFSDAVSTQLIFLFVGLGSACHASQSGLKSRSTGPHSVLCSA